MREYNKTNVAVAGGELQSTHRYKLQPPYFTGSYATFEEWKHKTVACLGLQNSEFPRLLQTAETSIMEVADALLRDGAATPQEAQLWVHLSRDLRHILLSLFRTSSSTVQTAQYTSTRLGDLEATTQQVLDTSRYT